MERQQRKKQHVESEHLPVQLGEFRVYLHQTRTGDCWNSEKTDQDGFGEFWCLMLAQFGKREKLRR